LLKVKVVKWRLRERVTVEIGGEKLAKECGNKDEQSKD
jgi:hypothetical protein